MQTWYLFAPKVGIIQNPADPKQYRLLIEGEILPDDVDKTGKVYAICTVGEGSLPQIDIEILSEMFLALQYQKESENIKLRQENMTPSSNNRK